MGPPSWVQCPSSPSESPTLYLRDPCRTVDGKEVTKRRKTAKKERWKHKGRNEQRKEKIDLVHSRKMNNNNLPFWSLFCDIILALRPPGGGCFT